MPGAPDPAGDEWPGLCHRCGAVLTPGDGTFYVVRMEAFADPSRLRDTGDDSATAVNVRELLEQIRNLSEQELMDQVYGDLTVLPCRACYGLWIEDRRGEGRISVHHGARADGFPLQRVRARARLEPESAAPGRADRSLRRRFPPGQTTPTAVRSPSTIPSRRAAPRAGVAGRSSSSASSRWTRSRVPDAASECASSRSSSLTRTM